MNTLMYKCGICGRSYPTNTLFWTLVTENRAAEVVVAPATRYIRNLRELICPSCFNRIRLEATQPGAEMLDKDFLEIVAKKIINDKEIGVPVPPIPTPVDKSSLLTTLNDAKTYLTNGINYTPASLLALISAIYYGDLAYDSFTVLQQVVDDAEQVIIAAVNGLVVV